MTESTTETQDEKSGPQTSYPEGNWKRKTSYAMGEYLKMDDETQTICRGGKRIKMVKNVAFHVPIIPIGDLDEYGKDLLDAMLAGKRDSINDIVEFFKNYEPQPGMTFNKEAFKDGQQANIDKEKEEERKLMREQMEDMIARANKYVFELDDPDFKKIPLMHPDTKKHTFEEWFEILYSVCDPKGLTDDQCIEVMEILMGGSYHTELKEMKAKKYSLIKIEKRFLKKDIITDPGCIFDKNDPDFKKIPFMQPDKKEKTFKEHIDTLYSVCDPKGFTDDQCTDVMEIRMGGSYLDELKELKDKNCDLETIELHFLSKDAAEEKKAKKKAPKIKALNYKKRAKREDDSEETEDLSYYRHITGIYKPYRPEMIRTLRSDSVERQLSPDRAIRSTSMLASSFNSPVSHDGKIYNERSMSAPREIPSSFMRGSFRQDSKVDDYMSYLGNLDTTKKLVRKNRDNQFFHTQNTTDVLGCWKHYNIHADSLTYRRGFSPAITTEVKRNPGNKQKALYRNSMIY